MKTAPINLKETFFNHYNKQQLKWGTFSRLLFSSQSSQPGDLPTTQTSETKQSAMLNLESSKSESKKTRQFKMTLRALAAPVAAHLALNKVTWKTFCRVLTGVLLYGVCAPLAEMAYTWMDKTDTVPAKVWYYESWFMLFLCLGPFLDKIITVTGLYLIFIHEKTKVLSFLTAWPIGLAVAKIIWLLQVTSHEEFHSVTPYLYVTYGVLIAIAYVALLNYLVWFKFHRKDSIEPRMDGVVQIAYDIDANKFRDSVVTTWKNKQRYDRLNANVQ